jgi:hypothetical protein
MIAALFLNATLFRATDIPAIAFSSILLHAHVGEYATGRANVSLYRRLLSGFNTTPG